MPVTKTCCVNGCKNKNQGADSGAIFYKFPADKVLRVKWVEACMKNNAIQGAEENWNPTDETVICNVHFVSGQKNVNDWHPDYIPSVFRSLRKGPTKAKRNFLEDESPVNKRAKRKDFGIKRGSLATPTHNTEKSRPLSHSIGKVSGKPKKVVLLKEQSIMDAFDASDSDVGTEKNVDVPLPTSIKKPLPGISEISNDSKLLKTLSVVLERTSDKEIKLSTGKIAIKDSSETDYTSITSPKKKASSAALQPPKKRQGCKKCGVLDMKIKKLESSLMGISSSGDCPRCTMLESKVKMVEEELEQLESNSDRCQKCSITDQKCRKIEGNLRKAQAEVNKLQSKISSIDLNEETLKKYKNKVKLYTGFPSYEALYLIFDHIKPYLPCDTLKFLSPFQMFIIVLMKLKLNFPFWDLTYRFGASPNHIQSFYPQFISVLEAELSHVVLWPKANLHYRLEVLAGNLKQTYNIIQKEIKVENLLVPNNGQLSEDDKTVRLCAALYHICQLVSSNHSQQLMRILKNKDETDRNSLMNEKDEVDKDGNKVLKMTELKIENAKNVGSPVDDLVKNDMNGDEQFDQNVDDSDIFFEDLTINGTTGVNSNESLKLECRNIRKELMSLNHKLSVQFKFYTGMRNYDVFNNLLSFLQSHVSHISTEKLTYFQQLYLILMRLKLNLEVQDLAYLFSVDPDHIVYLTRLWIDIIVKRLSRYIDWPSGVDDHDAEKRLLGTVKLKYQILWNPHCAPTNKVTGRQKEKFDSRQLLRACAALYNIDDIEVFKDGKRESKLTKTETDLESLSNEELEQICKDLRLEVFDLRKCVMSRIASCFSEGKYAKNDQMVQYYTGFPSFEMLKNVFNYIAPWKDTEGKSKSLSPFVQFIMVLLRLKLNVSNQDVGFRFGMGASNTHRLIQDWLSLLHLNLSSHITWPDDDEDVEFFTNILHKTYAFIRTNLYSNSRKDSLRNVDSSSGVFDIATLVCAGLYNIGEVSYCEPSDSEFDSFDEEW